MSESRAGAVRVERRGKRIRQHGASTAGEFEFLPGFPLRLWYPLMWSVLADLI
jgi:hypothetical protein